MWFCLYFLIPFNTAQRAYLTLPEGFTITKSSIPLAGSGVFSQIFLPKFTWLGEYEGVFVKTRRNRDPKELSYAWTVKYSELGFILHNISML